MSEIEPTIPDQSVTSDRTPGGTFAAGHKPMNGNRRPAKSRTELIADALWRALPPRKLKALAIKLVEEATAGTGDAARAARAELLNRLAGRPSAATVQKELADLRRDIDALKSLKSAPAVAEVGGDE